MTAGGLPISGGLSGQATSQGIADAVNAGTIGADLPGLSAFTSAWRAFTELTGGTWGGVSDQILTYGNAINTQ